ncbi:YkvA family protein [Pontibacillus marinus]|uniref:Membrane protein n=1 Tax=Pontibacillus marinus BH030004 = DSM 16465 TaxID=1385511 RepID=A0A0A5G9Q6_9BACI|nr:DUF1232 domain-containing protein [Pontibacillus marinus]KGX89886.1 membrane protein [Pontibacillus marinus BH030004 = DSM 16465]
MLKLKRRLKFLLQLKKSGPFLLDFFRSQEVENSKKILSVLLFVGYFLLPIDIIPDPLLFLGFVDDAAVLAFVLERIVKMAPESLKRKYGLLDDKAWSR